MKLKASGVQLQAGKSLYLNVFDNMYDLGLGVWTHPHSHPVYILHTEEGNVGLVQFDNGDFASEWLKEHPFYSVHEIIYK